MADDQDNAKAPNPVGKGALAKPVKRYPLRNRSPLRNTNRLSDANLEPGEILDDSIPQNIDELLNRDRHVNRRPVDSLPNLELSRSNPELNVNVNDSTNRTVQSHAERLLELERLCERIRDMQTEINAERIRMVERIESQETAVDDIEIQQAGHTQEIGRLGRVYEDVNARVEVNFDHIQRLTRGQANNISLIQEVRRDVTTLASRRHINTNAHNRPILNLKFPVFHAKISDKPLQFLNAIVRYVRLIDPAEENLHAILDQALQGPAHDWYEYVEELITSLEDFRQRFMRRYWNDAAQDRVRRELFEGVYHAENNVSMADYALQLYNRARYLDNAPNEAGIVKNLRTHFDREVQLAITCRQVSTIDDLIKTLEELDQLEPINLLRDNSRFSTPRARNPPSVRNLNRDNWSPRPSQSSPSTNWREPNNSYNDSGFSRTPQSRPYVMRNTNSNISNLNLSPTPVRRDITSVNTSATYNRDQTPQRDATHSSIPNEIRQNVTFSRNNTPSQTINNIEYHSPMENLQPSEN